MTEQLDVLFARCDSHVREIYELLVARCRELGDCSEDVKKTSVHITHGTAFAGLHPQKSKLRLNLRMKAPLDSPRLRKSEQVSANRYHNEIDLISVADVDAELVGWLRAARELTNKS